MSSNKRRATNVEIKTSKAFIICLFNPFSLVKGMYGPLALG